MVVTSFEELKQSVRYPGRGPVQVVLSDHHYWGGLRATQTLARICETFGLGVSMHSNPHLAPSLIAMTHLAAAVPSLGTPATPTTPGRKRSRRRGPREFVNGGVVVPRTPASASRSTARPCAPCTSNTCPAASAPRNDTAEMKKYDPSFTGKSPRY